MTNQQYLNQVNIINNKHKTDLNNLLNNYVKSNALFNIGDYIFISSFIIHVDEVTWQIDTDNIPLIVYHGLRIVKQNNQLLPLITKLNRLGTIYQHQNPTKYNI